MQFVVNVWHEFTSDDAFECTIPIALNGRRMRRLNIANPIQLVFLNGLDRLSDRYLAELRDLGYRIHDASGLVAELSPRLALFAERWRSFGTIRHYCLTRFLVMRRLFGGEALITFDGDMIVNAPLCEIARTLGSELYLLGGSSCFAALPAGTDFYAVLEDQVEAITRDPEAYARDVAGLRSADEFFTPRILRGSDQGIIALMVRRGLIKLGGGKQALEAAGLFGFANLMRLHNLRLPTLRYERREGVDLLGGRKVLIWHMSFGVCSHLGHYVFLRDWLGEDAVRTLGRLPEIPVPAGTEPPSPDIAGLLAAARRACRNNDALGTLYRNPYSRSRICRTFFEETDFSFALNDRSWHAAGLFAPPDQS